MGPSKYCGDVIGETLFLAHLVCLPSRSKLAFLLCPLSGKVEFTADVKAALESRNFRLGSACGGDGKEARG